MALNNKRVDANFSQGWPMAAFITALVVGAFATAGLIHKRTFKSPNDVTAEYRRQGAGEGAEKTAGEPKTGH